MSACIVVRSSSALSCTLTHVGTSLLETLFPRYSVTCKNVVNSLLASLFSAFHSSNEGYKAPILRSGLMRLQIFRPALQYKPIFLRCTGSSSTTRMDRRPTNSLAPELGRPATFRKVNMASFGIEPLMAFRSEVVRVYL